MNLAPAARARSTNTATAGPTEAAGATVTDPAALIAQVEEELALRAIADDSPAEIVAAFCRLVRGQGLPLARLMVAWRLLDPVYASVTMVWTPGSGVDEKRWQHGRDASPEFLASPIHYALTDPAAADTYRWHLEVPEERAAFPLLGDLADAGHTDYLLMRVGFGQAPVNSRQHAGVLLSLTCDAPGGFTEAQRNMLGRLRYMLALAMRGGIERSMRHTLAATYLGRSAGQKVLAGTIRRGEGETVDALVWYCDLRGSTALCEALGIAGYLPVLNDYFSATAGPVVAAGGEVLDFIGDAVLAIFPRTAEGHRAALSATREVLAALEAFRCTHAGVLPAQIGAGTVPVAGIAMAAGTVLYGNIGIDDRLTFSVIGPTVNTVSRIEGHTKVLGEAVLATREVAQADFAAWRGRGQVSLADIAETTELFALRTGAGTGTAAGEGAAHEAGAAAVA